MPAIRSTHQVQTMQNSLVLKEIYRRFVLDMQEMPWHLHVDSDVSTSSVKLAKTSFPQAPYTYFTQLKGAEWRTL